MDLVHGFLNREDRFQDFVFDLDQAAGFLRLFLCLRDNSGNTVANVTDFHIEKSSVMQEAIEAEPVPAAELRKAGRGISFLKSFGDRSVRDAMPTEAEIREILRMTDKTSPEDELNCGACGYSTCRDKAIAVFQHKAELEMCIPFMIAKAGLENVHENLKAQDADQIEMHTG